MPGKVNRHKCGRSLFPGRNTQCRCRSDTDSKTEHRLRIPLNPLLCGRYLKCTGTERVLSKLQRKRTGFWRISGMKTDRIQPMPSRLRVTTCMQWSKTTDISVLRRETGSHPIPQSFRITFGCMQRVSTDKERKRRKRGTDLCLQTSCPSASEQFCKRSILPLRTSLKSGFIVKTAK